MDDKNFYAAMSSYSEKYPDNDNIYMEIASQLEKLFCVNDYPDILDNNNLNFIFVIANNGNVSYHLPMFVFCNIFLYLLHCVQAFKN